MRRITRRMYPPYGRGHYGIDYLPGTGTIPIGPPERYRGGIFGQDDRPKGRYGIFRDYWALPKQMEWEDTGLFTPHQQRRVPGSSMDTGKYYRPISREPLGDLPERERQAVGTLLNYAGQKLYGPLPDSQSPYYTLEQRMRAGEKRSWLRWLITAGVVLALRRK